MDQATFLQLITSDARLKLLLDGFDGVAEFRFGNNIYRVRVSDAGFSLEDTGHAADAVVSYPPDVWAGATRAEPPRGLETLATSLSHGASLEGDWRTIQAPYFGAWSRVVRIVTDALAGREEVHVDGDPFPETDDPIGRYVRYSVGSENYRVYYEQAGRGDIPVLLLHTAGGDGRLYRNVLANPRLQQKYTMTAMDLPYHGKSLPPVGTRWWQRPLTVTKTVMMDWVTGFIRAAGLDRPIFVGCSVGGQLAPDLCAHHPESIRGAIGVNGLYDMNGLSELASMNALYRDPAAPPNVVSAVMYDASGPGAPEEFRHELAWIYASNQRDTYPADCEYYYFDHDLNEDGHLIDTIKTPLSMLTGEHDLSMFVPAHGGAAIAQKIPGATHRVMKGLSHFAPSDDPVRFGVELEAALEDLVARTHRSRIVAGPA
jgi:pimeloyl-ACP methyl ester carboxylesterase